jgi:hypothetical protein
VKYFASQNSSTTKYPARRPEKHRIFEKIEMKWQKEMEKTYTFREFYQDIVKDIIIKTAKTYRRS